MNRAIAEVERASNRLSCTAGRVDLLPAALAIFAESFDLVLLAQIANAHAGLNSTKEIPCLGSKESLLLDFTFVFRQEPRHFRLMEVGMDECSVKVDSGNELLGPG